MLDAPSIFQSTPSARRATANLGEQAVLKKISIHALREEGDQTPAIKEQSQTYFNPRPPRGGRLRSTGARWQSIPYFNPRPPRGGRRYMLLLVRCPSSISIHALREEGDRHEPTDVAGTANFNPRPPRGGRLEFVAIIIIFVFISIHALREEGDLTTTTTCREWCYFNPRPPRGGRPSSWRT